jgi:hypothetical protein
MLSAHPEEVKGTGLQRIFAERLSRLKPTERTPSFVGLQQA